MKLVMMGTGPFAIPTFQAILEDEQYDVVALVTRPVPTGRRRRSAPENPMREFAEQRDVPIFAPDSINADETISWLEEKNCDGFVVCDYGQILSNQALGCSKWGGINLHGSLLPRYRGSAPIQWAIYHGDPVTGVTVIHMTPGLDAGPILAQRTYELRPGDDAVSVEEALSKLGVEAVIETLENLRDWDGNSQLGTPQDKSLVSKAPRLNKVDGVVDWNRSTAQLQNQLRAFKPWPGSFTFLPVPNGTVSRLAIHEMEPVAYSDLESPPEILQPGQVVLAEGSQLCVATGDGIVNLTKIQPAGKRVMGCDEFLRGYQIKSGAFAKTEE